MRKLVLLLLLLLVCSSAHAQVTPYGLQGSSAAEGSHVFVGAVFNGVSISWQSSTTARYLMVFDGTALPSNGSTSSCNSTSSATGCLAYCLYLPESTIAPNRFTLDWTTHPAVMKNGIVVALSTGANCGTLTVDGTNDFFYSQVH